MSIHKLTAGSGYDYLTRQVAAQDVTERGHGGLASYYTAKGETPGVWVGSGMAGLDGLSAGDPVTEAQMRNLFGAGKHPLAEQLRRAAAEAGLDARGQDRAAWLGTPFPVYSGEVSLFRRAVAARVGELNAARGLPAGAPVDMAERARIRTEVGVELFREEHHRDPADAREVAAMIARHSRPRTTAVAGYDLTFSPVKSVSTLWAIADPRVAAVIEAAHARAVGDALAWLERAALFTREGHLGVRQVETTGMVAAAFTHRDSRAGDPDLHTHVALANKVQTRDGGRWLAIDGRVLFKATVAASETYNTALEHHLRAALGVRFEARPGGDARKRPVREIVGVDPALAARWSTRRASIQDRRSVLATQFQATHGRPPTPIESIQLAQQATLETRQAKHEPRSLAEQRTTWAAQARQVLGGQAGVRDMLAAVLSGPAGDAARIDSAWIRATAADIATTLPAARSVWQVWHVRAEALRRLRGTDLTAAGLDTAVGLLVDQVLTEHCVALTRPGDALEVPPALRRSDGTSVYTVAGASLYTSPALLAAEARILARAGQHDGARAPAGAVQTAIAARAAAGSALNAGQATLVREMATSGARLQLAIAPAGAGKTTAMRALADAWARAGGQVLGLAPSAAAAGVLGENIDAPTDTLAKLTWHLDHPDLAGLPHWAQRIGRRTLVLLDEAGMADTITLDRVVEHVTARGGSVRLIGDDQQLAAVGAGGVLRDIAATHGALHLTQLMRFADPAEAAASLALRDGLPEALGFYLDTGRVHVGDLATLTDDVFTAWAAARSHGTDAIMLAPTRDLVAELNQRARTHRLATTDRPDRPTTTVTLADGNPASAGDTVITRTNDRTLRTTATDWVKNGDRWRVTRLAADGSLTVQHLRNGHHVTLPAGYVTASVELGYACTIHTAQGVTADVSHTLITGSESRQLAYAAATRGRTANHLYLQVVGDGDPHNIIRPDHTHPPTATDLLEQILARDDSSRSATTTRREDHDPAAQLGPAVARYLDSLGVAAEHLLGPDRIARLEALADQIVPHLTRAPAWPALRAHLTLLSAHGLDPVTALHTAATTREVDTAADPAAVIDGRLDDTGLRSAGTGPLPWLPGVPQALVEDPVWGPYLAGRAAAVRALTAQVAAHATTTALPAWARQGQARPSPDLLADVAVWRAATAVPATDRRPTGPTQRAKAPHRWQAQLDTALARGRTPALAEWADAFDHILHRHRTDPFTPLLAERLAAISRAGIDAPTTVRRALAAGPLPDDHQGAALWWRITRHLSPAVAAQADGDNTLTTTWTRQLPGLVGAAHATALRQSSWWPALVAVIDQAIARGHTLQTLLQQNPASAPDDVDPGQALLWRIGVLIDPPPADQDRDAWPILNGPQPGEENPFHNDHVPANPTPTDAEWADLRPLDGHEPVDQTDAPAPPRTDTDPVDDAETGRILAWAARAREYAQPLPPTDREIDTQLARAYDADTAPVSPERILELNRLALAYYTSRFPGSWAQDYLADRLGVDLTGDPHVHPGYAPTGWTNLVTHLRGHGATDLELTTSALATTTRTGRIIDRFRDRLVLPITRPDDRGQAPLGFIGRSNPNTQARHPGPKYLNTPDTPVFHKGAQLYTVRADLLDHGATPVLVEGPIDALAISLAGAGTYVGMAPLGTALTEEQAAQLAHHAHHQNTTPIVATDADLAGLLAAHRDYWLLTQHGLNPRTAPLRPGSDPADALALQGPHALHQVLDNATPLADTLIHERLTNLTGTHAARHAVTILAAAHPHTWEHGTALISEHTGIPATAIRHNLAATVRAWDQDPRTTVSEQIAQLPTVRDRLTATSPNAGTPDHHPTASPKNPPRTPNPQPRSAPSR